MAYPNYSFYPCSHNGNFVYCDVRTIAIKTLREFWTKNRDAEQPLRAWYHEARKAKWTNPTQIKAQYRSASILKNNRVVFNIAGNKYRLVVRIHYQIGIVYIRFIGTHVEYDQIHAEEI